jgi:hypothetical protein
LADTLYSIVLDKNIKSTSLSVKKRKQGNIDDKWKIIINTEIEPDL